MSLLGLLPIAFLCLYVVKNNYSVPSLTQTTVLVGIFTSFLVVND